MKEGVEKAREEEVVGERVRTAGGIEKVRGKKRLDQRDGDDLKPRLDNGNE